MAQVWKVRLPDGRVLIPGDWTSAEPLYSTIEFDDGAITTLSAFSYGIGQPVPGSPGPRRSTPVDTNLEGEGARLPENEELICYVCGVELFFIGTQGSADEALGAPPPDEPFVGLLNVLRCQEDVVVVFRIASVKEYTRAPLGWFPAGTGTKQVNSASRSVISAGDRGWIAGNNGGTSVYDTRELASPLYVAGGESLSVDFLTPAGQIADMDVGDANARIRARCYLNGYRRRPVA